MPDSIHPRRLTRSPRARLLALATLATGVLLAGCGGSSPSSTTATVGSPTNPASSQASSGSATTTGSSTATGASATNSGSSAPGAAGSGTLAFAKCMRSNGVPNFPDPGPGDGATFRVPVGSNPAAPAFRTAQAKCQKLLPGGGLPGSGAPASAQTLAKLLRIARCMRQHGVPEFPDPQASAPSNPAGAREITDFDGAFLVFPSTINMQAPAYRQALTACGAPPLGPRH
jgi:hypothetical protein